MKGGPENTVGLFLWQHIMSTNQADHMHGENKKDWVRPHHCTTFQKSQRNRTSGGRLIK